MTAPTADVDLFEFGRQCLDRLVREFRAYGLEADPGLELRRGRGLLCYYNFEDRHIYFALPDPAAPGGKLHQLIFRDTLRAESDDDLRRFLRLFIPFIIAHELAHHFRHRYGLFGEDKWREEQVANQLAVAVNKHRLSPDDKTYARRFLQRALEGLAQKLGAGTGAADSYHDIAQALNVSGHLSDGDLESLELIRALFTASTVDILQQSGQLSAEAQQRLAQREALIESINEAYTSDALRYIYYQVGWVYLAMTGSETQYVEEFAHQHLNRRPELLPDVEAAPAALPNLQACFKAHQDAAPFSETASRYFYKRYRSLLLARLQTAAPSTPDAPLWNEALALLDNQCDRGTDMLNYLAALAPASLQDLFPQRIAGSLPANLALPADLPTETDVRLWQHGVRQAPDAAAANLLQRLALLEGLELFAQLPAETLLSLAHRLCRMKLAPGETIVWEGELNDDVYILTEGQLEVLAPHSPPPRRPRPGAGVRGDGVVHAGGADGDRPRADARRMFCVERLRPSAAGLQAPLYVDADGGGGRPTAGSVISRAPGAARRERGGLILTSPTLRSRNPSPAHCGEKSSPPCWSTNRA